MAARDKATVAAVAALRLEGSGCGSIGEYAEWLEDRVVRLQAALVRIRGRCVPWGEDSGDGEVVRMVDEVMPNAKRTVAHRGAEGK